MRIVQIITRSDTVGGPHVLVRDLAKYLEEKGHEVIVLVGQSGRGPFPPELARNNIKFEALNHLLRPIRPWRDVMGLSEIARHLHRLEPDIVNAHSSKAGWLARVVGRFMRVPTVFTVHGWAFTAGIPSLKRALYLVAEKIASPLGSHFITVSEYDRDLGLQYGVARREDMTVIHNGVPDIPVNLRGEPGRTPPRIIMVARFEFQKDHATLLKALAELKDLPWQVDFVGEGPLRGEMEKMAARLGLARRVKFWGFRLDVEELLSRAQIFALISRWEGFPCSILEAMRAGLPLVTSQVGGVAEAVRDGENGFLIPRENKDCLKDRLEELLCDENRRISMGKRARRDYEERFTLRHFCQNTLSLYREVIATGASYRLRKGNTS